MKNIEQLQFVILNEEGEILFCDDNLFSISDVPSTCVFDWSPFIESIFPTLLKRNKQVFTFEKVETFHDFLNGIYDYSFYKNEGKNKDGQIIWVISDCSEYYGEVTKEQQIHHQMVIEREVANFKKNTIPTLSLLKKFNHQSEA